MTDDLEPTEEQKKLLMALARTEEQKKLLRDVRESLKGDLPPDDPWPIASNPKHEVAANDPKEVARAARRKLLDETV